MIRSINDSIAEHKNMVEILEAISNGKYVKSIGAIALIKMNDKRFVIEFPDHKATGSFLANEVYLNSQGLVVVSKHQVILLSSGYFDDHEQRVKEYNNTLKAFRKDIEILEVVSLK